LLHRILRIMLPVTLICAGALLSADVCFAQAAPAVDAANAATQAVAQPAGKLWFDPNKTWLAVMVLVLCGSVLLYVMLARMGRPMWVRPIAALQAVDEAVGRATEMGRPCLFVAGIQDVDDMGTIAGVSVLGRISRTVADYGAEMYVPTTRGLTMTACREAVQAAYYQAGRPDAYDPDRITYITDEQFGFVAYLVGWMVRSKPAACFYMGTFFAESLLLAETGHSIGAIQIAGTRETSQLPFFVAACDYTLIGEEFFAASAYLSGQPDQLGSLKGQDLGKAILGGIIIVGCVLATVAAFTPDDSWLQQSVNYVQNVVLR
jgi:hypothetical protein